MFSEIIVPVDIGEIEQAKTAISAAKVNLAPGGHITLLHVLEPLPGYVTAQLDSSILNSGATEAESKLLALRESENLPADTSLLIESGRPYSKICEKVTDPNTQAIVMSAHRPQFSDIFLGSVAAQVVRHAKSSVFVLRVASNPD